MFDIIRLKTSYLEEEEVKLKEKLAIYFKANMCL